MIYIILFILLNIFVWGAWAWRYRIKPYYEKKNLFSQMNDHPNKDRYFKTFKLLNAVYKDVNPDKVSRREKKRLKLQADDFLYGEVDFLSFVTVLDKVQPQPGEVFCDLGSGAGKAVFTAAMNFDFAKSIGVEYLPGLCDVAKDQIQKTREIIKSQYADFAKTYLQRLASIHIINDDFLNFDLQKCNIVFINATALNYYTWEKIMEKLLGLAPGSRVIVTTKKIQHEQFETLYQGFQLMSWGMNSLNIYRRS